MSDKYILAHDLGTSSNKAVLVSTNGEIIQIARQSYPVYHPQPHFAEQNPEEWWQAVCNTSREVIQAAGCDVNDVVGLTFSVQMQCLIPVNRNGQPLMNAISWLDNRGAEVISDNVWIPPRLLGYNIPRLLKFLRITGGAPSQTGKDQIAKILWLKENKPALFQATWKFMDAKDYILFKLTGETVTSVDLAVVWWMLDTRNNTNSWNPELVRLGGIHPDQLPKVRESASIIGQLTASTAKKLGLASGTPVVNGCGDLSAAAVGSGALREGELHISLGTSSWVAGHFTKRKTDILHYCGCIGSAYPGKYFLAMAHQETAGACLEWIKSNLLRLTDIPDSENTSNDIFVKMDNLVQQSNPGAAGLMFTPWMYGERCPVDDDQIRAGLVNLSLNHTTADIIRAVFEGIAMNTRWALETLEHLYQPVDRLNMIGGGAKSEVWCQIFADVLNRTIYQVQDPQQAGARGVALLASLTLGFIDTFENISSHIDISAAFQPNPQVTNLYSVKFKAFKKLYKNSRKWHRQQNHREMK